MKKIAKWIGVWLVWLIVVLAIMLVVIEPVFSVWYENFYWTVVAERKELYTQVDSLNSDFDEVYKMRNAEIINAEEPVIVLNNDKFTLKVKFNQSRTEVIGIEETRVFSTEFWIIVTLVVATLLYLPYSMGKPCRKKRIKGNNKETKVRNQEWKKGLLSNDTALFM